MVTIVSSNVLVGIHTFTELAASSWEQLQAILTQAGPHLRMHAPSPWRGQARLATEERWDQLGERDNPQRRKEPAHADAASSA